MNPYTSSSPVKVERRRRGRRVREGVVKLAREREVVIAPVIAEALVVDREKPAEAHVGLVGEAVQDVVEVSARIGLPRQPDGLDDLKVTVGGVGVGLRVVPHVEIRQPVGQIDRRRVGAVVEWLSVGPEKLLHDADRRPGISRQSVAGRLHAAARVVLEIDVSGAWSRRAGVEHVAVEDGDRARAGGLGDVRAGPSPSRSCRSSCSRRR
jgi:hypothetical protein